MNKVVFSPAKINFSLAIGPKRKDGFHAIQSLVLPLKNVGDFLTFQPCKGLRVNAILGSPLKEKKSAFPLPAEKENLIWKAATLFFETSQIKPSIQISLEKKAPFGAGLGSGSSNAAFTLLTLNQIFGKPLSFPTLCSLATPIGSDVAYFLLHQPAWISGRGEEITPLAFKLSGWFVITNPGFQISTPEAYKWWDQKVDSLTNRRWNDTSFLTSVSDWTVAKTICKNDFEEVIFPAYPELQTAHQDLLTKGAKMVALSGSGPTLFGLFETRQDAKKAALDFKEKNWFSWVTQQGE